MVLKHMDNLITQTAILSRPGWTKTLLGQLLGEPDLRKKIYGRTNLACLYSEPRVIAAEKSDAFARAQANIAKRKLAGQKSVRTKIATLLAAVDAMPVFVKKIDEGRLRRIAVDAYNELHWDSDMPASVRSDSLFLDRICVNFIRHELTNYDVSLEETAGKVGVAAALSKIRTKVYSAIERVYPMFSQECKNQLHKRCIDL